MLEVLVALLVFALGVLGLVGLQATAVKQAGQAKYVILLIGDGMGMAQRNAAELYLAAQKGDTTPGIVKLNMSQLPVQGATTTYSIDSLITDSAAAGTAMALA